MNAFLRRADFLRRPEKILAADVRQADVGKRRRQADGFAKIINGPHLVRSGIRQMQTGKHAEGTFSPG